MVKREKEQHETLQCHIETAFFPQSYHRQLTLEENGNSRSSLALGGLGCLFRVTLFNDKCTTGIILEGRVVVQGANIPSRTHTATLRSDDTGKIDFAIGRRDDGRAHGGAWRWWWIRSQEGYDGCQRKQEEGWVDATSAVGAVEGGS